jgi:choline dehydrogenase-like flavoprotein
VITDFETLPSGQVLTADVCIVGSGPAGLTLASTFANTKYNVILLEAGGFDFETRTQDLYQGTVIGRSYPIAFSRLRMFGGTSGHWGGQCGIRPARHFQRRPGVTDAYWPVGLAELLPYYRKASRLLEVGLFDYGNRQAERIASVTQPSPEGPLATFIWRGRVKGPLRFGVRMRKDMEQAQNISVLLHTNVTELVTNQQASQLEEVRFSTLDGKRGLARARFFVLACGGLETPRLLLSTTRVQPFGLGNPRGMVGRYFMDHTNARIGTLYLGNAKAATALSFYSHKIRDSSQGIGVWQPALCLSERFERERQVGGGYYRFSSTDPTWIDGVSRVTSRNVPLFERIHSLAQFFDEGAYALYRFALGYSAGFSRFANKEVAVGVEFEPLPNWDSRVFLTSERDRLGLRRLALDWRLTEHEIRTARAMGEAIGREAYLQGWGRFKFVDWLLDDGIKGSDEFAKASHHMGTVRMAEDPQFGVVDPKCRLFGCDNVYVAGSAVFPTASFDNPTLTIVALAYRMADDLKERLA